MHNVSISPRHFHFRIVDNLPVPIVPMKLGGFRISRRERLSLVETSRISGWTRSSLKSLYGLVIGFAAMAKQAGMSPKQMFEEDKEAFIGQFA